mgnify:CR=1 FL=1
MSDELQLLRECRGIVDQHHDTLARWLRNGAGVDGEFARVGKLLARIDAHLAQNVAPQWWCDVHGGLVDAGKYCMGGCKAPQPPDADIDRGCANATARMETIRAKSAAPLTVEQETRIEMSMEYIFERSGSLPLPVIMARAEGALRDLALRSLAPGFVSVPRDFLAAGRCQNKGCNGEWYAVKIDHDEWEQQQCQWCDERKAMLAAGGG